VHWEWLALKRSPSAELERVGKIFVQKRQAQLRRSAKGQTETLGRVPDWSVHPLTADMTVSRRQVRFVPDSDMHHFVGAKLRARQAVIATRELSFPR
jgi:hypothetical protein